MRKHPALPADVESLLHDAKFKLEIGYVEIQENDEAIAARARWPHLVAIGRPLSNTVTQVERT